MQAMTATATEAGGSAVPGDAPVAVAPRRPRVAAAAADVAVAVAAALVVLRTVLPQVTEHVLGRSDHRYWTWVGWRVAGLARDGRVPWRIPDVVRPYGSDLGTADGPLPTALGALWAGVVGRPALALNLTIATAIATNALAAMVLARRCSASAAVARVCGFAFALAPVVAVRAEDHVNLLFMAPLVLMVAAAVGTVGGHPVRPVVHGALLAVCFLSSGYHALLGALGFTLIVGCTGGRNRTVAVRLLATAAVAALVVSPLLVARLSLERAERRAGAEPMAVRSMDYGADALGPVIPAPGSLLRPGGERPGMEEVAFLGVPLLTGLAAFAWSSAHDRRRRVDPPAGRNAGGDPARRLRRAVALTATVAWVVSLGPVLTVAGWTPTPRWWLPGSFLAVAPGLSTMRAPNRAGFLLALTATIALALVLQRLQTTRPQWWRPVGVAVVVAAVAGVPAAPTLDPLPYGPAIAGAMSALAAGAPDDPPVLLALPGTCERMTEDVTAQIVAPLPQVGCQAMTAALPFASGLDRLQASEAWAALRCLPERLGTVVRPDRSDLAPSLAAARALHAELDVDVVLLDRTVHCTSGDPGRADAARDAVVAAGRVLADDGRYVLVVLDAGGPPVSGR